MTGHERAKRRALIVRRARAMRISAAMRAHWQDRRLRQGLEVVDDQAGDPDADLAELPESL